MTGKRGRDSSQTTIILDEPQRKRRCLNSRPSARGSSILVTAVDAVISVELCFAYAVSPCPRSLASPWTPALLYLPEVRRRPLSPRACRVAYMGTCPHVPDPLSPIYNIFDFP